MLHLLFGGLVALMVFLGFWQLDRLEDKRQFNSNVLERTAVAPTAVENLLQPGNVSDPDLEWRIVTAAGTYQAGGEVTIINRSLDGVAGYSPMTPLLLDTGVVVYVQRGFVPLATATPPPTTGRVVVTGYLRPSQARSVLGAVDSTDPTATEFHRADIGLISGRLEEPHLSMWVQLIEQSPAAGSPWPQAARPPDLDEGPHFSYALQWWFFSLVALAGWIVVAGRAVRAARVSPGVPGGTSS
jgi:cytochrome oxidase assembly protein ShyY1